MLAIVVFDNLVSTVQVRMPVMSSQRRFSKNNSKEAPFLRHLSRKDANYMPSMLNLSARARLMVLQSGSIPWHTSLLPLRYSVETGQRSSAS